MNTAAAAINDAPAGAAPRPWAHAVVVGLCIGSVGLFAATGWPVWVALPFAALYFGLMVLNWKAAWWVLLACIPLSVQVFFFNLTLSTSFPDEPMMAAFLGLLFVLLIARRKALPEWALRHPITLLVALQLVWTTVAVIYSTDHFRSAKFFLAKNWFLASFFVLPVLIFREKKDFKRGFLLLYIPTLLTMAVIFARHYTMGFGFRRIEKAIMHIYYNHVDYSTVMSMVLPLAVVAWPLTKGTATWKRAALAGSILFFLPAIYLTYARAAMIAVVFAGAVGVAIRLRLVNWVMPAFYAFVIFGFSWAVRGNKYLDYYPDFKETYMHYTWTDHMIATFKGQDMSSVERLYRWIAAVRMSKDRPLVGYGPNNFYTHYKPYAVQSFRTYVSRNPEESTTHNYFLLMLVEQGWPAMLLYAILVPLVFAHAQRTYRRFRGDIFYRACTLGVAMMFAACFINNFFSELIETHKVGALFYLSLSLLVVLGWKSRNATRDVA